MNQQNSELLLTIQSDWDSILPSLGGSVWISAKSRNQPSVHGKIKRIESRAKGSEPEHFEITDNFLIKKFIDTLSLIISYDKMKTLFLAPTQTFHIHNKEVVSIDTNGTNKAVTSSDKLFNIWETKSKGNIHLKYAGHLMDVNKAYYFPSGVVIVSCSLDMQIKIVCAETGNNPRTLIGHTRSVTDISIVSKGKNIISVSKDCRAILWHVGENKIISELIKTNFPILCCDIISTTYQLPHVESNPLEIDTEDKLLLLGCENGLVVILAVQSKKIIFEQKLNVDVKSVKFINESEFLIGLSNGKIQKFQINQNENKNLQINSSQWWHYTDSCVQCILPLGQYGYITGYYDGHCVFQFYNNLFKQIHLTGSLFDPIFDLSYDGNYIFTACRDGKIRKYSLDDDFIKKTFSD